MNLMLYIHLLSFVILSILPLVLWGRRQNSAWNSADNSVDFIDQGLCTQEERIDMIEKLNTSLNGRFTRFFEPDCNRTKKYRYTFRPDRQGCLAALKWLQVVIGPEAKFVGTDKPIFRLIACNSHACKGKPVFKKCGSNQRNHSNPIFFKNGCSQCVISCKEVLKKRKRYVRLDAKRCMEATKEPKSTKAPGIKYTTLYHATRGFYNTSPFTTSNRIYNNIKATPFRTTTTMVPTTEVKTTDILTTELITTERLTTELITTTQGTQCVSSPMRIREPPKVQYCALKQSKCKVDCYRVQERMKELKLPKLPPWRPIIDDL